MELYKLKEEMEYRWKPQSSVGDKMLCVAFINSRDVMERLDSVCEPSNWQTLFKSEKGTLFCGIGIKIGSEWVWKWDAGTESNVDKAKGEASDAFKRAAVHWGIGRFLYTLGTKKVPGKKWKEKMKPCDENGNIFWDNKDLTAYINNGKPITIQQPQQPTPVDTRPHRFTEYVKAEANNDPKEMPGVFKTVLKECGLPESLKSKDLTPANMNTIFEKIGEQIEAFEKRSA